MSHTLRMLAGCVLPLLLIFLFPLLGISEGVTLLVAIVLMFACHLLMMGHHGHGREEQTKKQREPKKESIMRTLSPTRFRGDRRTQTH